MEQAQGAGGPPGATWWKRENLLPGLALLVLAAVAWVYTLSQASGMETLAMPAATRGKNTTSMSTEMDTMGNMELPTGSRDNAGGMEPAATMVQPGGLTLFLVGWAVMMVAMMLPAALPLLLLYRTIARKRFRPREATIGLVALLAGYVGIWTVAGLPVYAYSLLAAPAGPLLAVVPGLMLIIGGVYQFTALKQGCHSRCSSPFFFVMNKWRPGVTGALRLGILHGIDCLGCCVGLMLALVALGMMQVAWMLTAAVIIFVEKTFPGGHRVARPLGVVLVLGGVVLLILSMSGSRMAM